MVFISSRQLLALHCTKSVLQCIYYKPCRLRSSTQHQASPGQQLSFSVGIAFLAPLLFGLGAEMKARLLFGAWAKQSEPEHLCGTVRNTELRIVLSAIFCCVEPPETNWP